MAFLDSGVCHSPFHDRSGVIGEWAPGLATLCWTARPGPSYGFRVEERSAYAFAVHRLDKADLHCKDPRRTP